MQTNLDTPLIVAYLFSLFSLALLVWHHCKINRLERQLISQHRFFRQEMHLLTQGAIGMGQKIQRFEKEPAVSMNFQSVPEKANETIPMLKETEKHPQIAPKKPQSLAEKELAHWMALAQAV